MKTEGTMNKPCKGRNCATTDYSKHSVDCQLEHAGSYHGVHHEFMEDMFAALDALRLQLTASEKPAYLRGQRSIVAAAVMLSDGVIVCGVRHFDKIMRDAIEAMTTKAMTVDKLVKGALQGFVANDYQFVSREEAWIVALRAGQFDPMKATGTQGTLYSEDLW